MWGRHRKRTARLPKQLALGLLEDAMGRAEQKGPERQGGPKQPGGPEQQGRPEQQGAPERQEAGELAQAAPYPGAAARPRPYRLPDRAWSRLTFVLTPAPGRPRMRRCRGSASAATSGPGRARATVR